MKMVRVMGTDIPFYQKCNKCGKPDAVAWNGITHPQPCADCRTGKEVEGIKTVGSVIRSERPAGVWEGKGRTFYTNSNGDVIKDEPYKPLEVGRQEKPVTRL